MILALDLATKTGWAYRDRSGKIISGMWDFTAKKSDWVDRRYFDFYYELSNHVPDGNLTIWYEEPTPQGTNNAKVLYGLLAVVKVICYEYDITLHVDSKNRGVAPKTLKKWATGNGNASKSDMIIAAQSQDRVCAINDDNEADAVCLLAYAEMTACNQ